MSDPKAAARAPRGRVLVRARVPGRPATRPTAGAAIDAFISAYPASPRVPDLLYQRGRILYSKGDYEDALKVFAAFSTAAPRATSFPRPSIGAASASMP